MRLPLSSLVPLGVAIGSIELLEPSNLLNAAIGSIEPIDIGVFRDVYEI